MFYDPSKSVLQMLKMLKNAVAKITNVLQMTKHGYLICIIHIVGVSRCLISARPCPISLFLFKFGLIFHIHSAFCGMSI